MKKKYILIIGVIIITAIILCANGLAAWFIKSKLEENKVSEFFQFEKLTVNLLNQQITLKSIHFQKNGLEVKVEKLKLKGLEIMPYLQSKTIIINKISAETPIVRISPNNKNDSASKNTSNIWLKNINLSNAEIVFSNDSTNQMHQVFGLQLDLENLDSLSIISKNPNVLLSNISHFELDSTKSSAIKYHHLSTKKVKLNTNSITVLGTAISPIHKYYKGEEKPPFVVTWTNLTVDSIHATYGINEILDNYLHCKNVIIKGAQADLSTDQRLPKKEGFNPRMPNELIAGIEFPIHLEKVQIKKTDIKYAERAKGSSESGHVTFNNFDATITNITNDSSLIATNSHLKAKINSNLMNSKNLYVTIDYDLASKDGAHTITGALKDFDLKKLNVAFEPLAQVIFETGQLNELDFRFNANKYEAKGTADFKYEDLKVVLINEKKITSPRFLSRLETLAANAFVVKKANPLRGNYEEGIIDYQRNFDKSFLNFWWKSAFSGMKSTMVRGNQ